ncbi:hypothetical protein Hanom_Chr10g00952151 [Helianthus anomalus]
MATSSIFSAVSSSCRPLSTISIPLPPNLLDDPTPEPPPPSFSCCTYKEPTPAAKKSIPSSTGTSLIESNSRLHWMHTPNIGGAPVDRRGENGNFVVLFEFDPMQRSSQPVMA